MTTLHVLGSGSRGNCFAVESDGTAILVDCGQGIIRGLMDRLDPRTLYAIIVGHLHADHYIDPEERVKIAMARQ